jgi:hypothetical protein
MLKIDRGNGDVPGSHVAELVGTIAILGGMADPMLDTASQRPATGLDSGARRLIMQVVDQPPRLILSILFVDRYAGVDDYLNAVERVWGPEFAAACRRAVEQAQPNPFLNPAVLGRALSTGDQDRMAESLLRVMPEPDFRKAIDLVDSCQANPATPGRITEICRSRVAPWEFHRAKGFQWIGDHEIETNAVRPALSAIEHPAFAGGVKDEFDSARAELALGTPKALSQSIHQSGNTVESAMKVVLDKHKVSRSATATAKPLFDALEQAGVVPKAMEKVILAPSGPRNQMGAHGAGAQPHAVTIEEAETVFASAAVAIAYLSKLLPS